MFVITADQSGSRRAGDKVADILEQVSDRDPDEVLMPFERTVGDEIQGVPSGPEACLDVALALQRHQDWSVGIGIGAGELATDARSSTGPAFVAARAAVERAKSKAVTVPIALDVDPENSEASHEAEALLQLLAAVVRRRSDAGWEVVDLLNAGAQTHKQAASVLGISQQSVSQRLRAALWSEERNVRPLAIRMLTQLEQGVTS